MVHVSQLNSFNELYMNVCVQSHAVIAGYLCILTKSHGNIDSECGIPRKALQFTVLRGVAIRNIARIACTK